MNTRKLIFAVGLVVFLSSTADAKKLLFSKDKTRLEADGSVEFIQNYMNNQRDINSSIDDDEFFPAIQYGTNLDLIYSGLELDKGDVFFHSLIERKGRLGYAANLSKVDLSDTRELKRYHFGQELLPRMRELYVNAPLGSTRLRTTFGLHRYAIGWTGQLFGSKDPNYGLTLTYTHPLKMSSFVYNFHWDRPDYNNKWRIEFKRPQQQDNESSSDTRAHRIVTDLGYYWDYNMAQLMVSFMSDRTGRGKRAPIFFTNVTSDRDVIGNVGGSFIHKLGKDFVVYLEAARNFGKISNLGAGGNGGDIEHEGFMYGAKLAYHPATWIQPTAKFLYFSGNNTTIANMNAGNTNSLTKSKGYEGGYSLGNENLADTVNTVISGGFPLLSMAGLHGVMKGVGRPGSFNDPTGKENLMLAHLSLNLSLVDKLTWIVDYFDLWAVNAGFGQFGNPGNVTELEPHLGDEFNLILSYPVCKNINVTSLSAYYIPGAYYEKTGRTDNNAVVFSPIVGDGTPDNAYSSEIAVKWWF